MARHADLQWLDLWLQLSPTLPLLSGGDCYIVY